MSHLDPELAALIAMGEHDAATDEQSAHLAECLECADEVAAFAMAAGAARGALVQPPLLTPPPRVWEAIAAEVGFTPGGAQSPAADVTPASPVDAPTAHDAPAALDPALPASAAAPAAAPPPAPATDSQAHHAAPPTEPRPPADASSHGTPRSAASHRVPRRGRVRRLPLLLALAGTLAVVAMVIGVWATQNALAPNPQIVAEATLDGFPAHEGARGVALLEEVDGRNQVVVTLDATVPDDGYREVWLLADDGSDLVSLGVLEGSEGVFDVPAGVDLAKFSVVDVSQEAEDGDQTHSGDSIVRGALQPA
ncbi:anti-sigma factor [Microbacterium sp. zg.Y625]|uniref:anti-sigma factor n=1 Tax=Microbacterium jiangjiandongii TaxID=3049071 RepID=UPI00214C47F6|nr:MULTISPECIES: anti-sigma factor [unclassified Microbacterium]MCR2793041.1 anti-sigma factor [Microbacterium sp. zg.Y625]MCR2814317.1 anti-sigma factor [Microbacterium sp. zg.Y843]WIM24156.1 anti-sigma factor [Microbacterium sp. zg-Y625]